MSLTPTPSVPLAAPAPPAPPVKWTKRQFILHFVMSLTPGMRDQMVAVNSERERVLNAAKAIWDSGNDHAKGR